MDQNGIVGERVEERVNPGPGMIGGFAMVSLDVKLGRRGNANLPFG